MRSSRASMLSAGSQESPRKSVRDPDSPQGGARKSVRDPDSPQGGGRKSVREGRKSVREVDTPPKEVNVTVMEEVQDRRHTGVALTRKTMLKQASRNMLEQARGGDSQAKAVKLQQARTAKIMQLQADREPVRVEGLMTPVDLPEKVTESARAFFTYTLVTYMYCV